jgi:hypothetical protein
VSMIYHIFMDIRALLLVLVLVCVGFSQAFWLLSNTTNAEAYNFQSDYPFSSIKMSFVNSFSYMLVLYIVVTACIPHIHEYIILLKRDWIDVCCLVLCLNV